MPRSSRHKSHRPHKHRDTRERSKSEEDGNSRERKQREEPTVGSGTRVCKDPQPEKRKPSSLSQPSQGKDSIDPRNGDSYEEHGRKRKDRLDDSAAADRWNGGGGDDRAVDKESRGEGFGPVDLEKTAKSKLSVLDSKGRASRRREGSSERNEEIGGKVESTKPRSEKDSNQRESSSQYKDTKEKDRDRGSERDKKVLDTRHEIADNVAGRKQCGKLGSSDDDRVVKSDIENTECLIQEELRNPELEKELEKRIRRRDGSGDKDKLRGDGRDSVDKRLPSRDDQTKHGSYKDEKHRDGRYRDKYREDLDRDQRHRDDRHRDECSSRDHTSDRSDNQHFRDENKPSENRFRKSKFHDNDPDRGAKFKDDRGRKRSSDETEVHSDLKPRNAKEPRGDMEKIASSTSKLDSHGNRGRPEYLHSDKVETSLGNKRPKSSPSSSAHAVKDQSRHNSRQSASTRRESPSEERLHPTTASTGDLANVVRERVFESQMSENVASSLHDKAPKSDGHASPMQLTEKSPSSTSDRRYSNRSGAKRSLDIEEVGPRSSNFKDGRDYSSIEDRGRELPLEKPILDDHSQAELFHSKPVPVGSSSFNRAGHFSGSSPSHLPLPPPVRLGIDSPSVLGSYEDDNRVQIGDHKSSIRYKRNGDLKMGRGQGNVWNSVPNWASPVANGFIPFQHVPPPGGFHPVVQQFPTPSLFGVSHAGAAYHVHEASDRFSGHGRPFGWHTPVDDSCPPHMQGWDGGNGVFGDESHVYGRADWDQNRHLMGPRGWEMRADMWKGKNGNVNMEFPLSQKEPDYSTHAPVDEASVGQSGHLPRNERVQSERFPAGSIEVKRSNDTSSVKNAVETPKTTRERTPECSKRPADDSAHFCCNYLSKLDISLDLSHPELYKKCMSLAGTRNSTGICNISKHAYNLSNKEDIKVAAEGPNYILNALFPPITDALFQRAISLYEKHNERTKVKLPAISSILSKEVLGSPEGSDTENVKPADKQTPSENTSRANANPANANSPNNAEEGSNASTNTKGDLPGDFKEHHSDIISDAIVFAEGSNGCEALLSECRVNLSRIHNPPESTH